MFAFCAEMTRLPGHWSPRSLPVNATAHTTPSRLTTVAHMSRLKPPFAWARALERGPQRRVRRERPGSPAFDRRRRAPSRFPEPSRLWWPNQSGLKRSSAWIPPRADALRLALVAGIATVRAEAARRTANASTALRTAAGRMPPEEQKAAD